MNKKSVTEGANNPFALGGTSPPQDCHIKTTQETICQEWLTATEAACYLRCSVKTLYNYKCVGKIKGENRGGTKKGQLLFRKNLLDNFIFGKRG